MVFLFWFRAIKMLLKLQDNFDQICACFINICSTTEGKKGALLNYCLSSLLLNCLPHNVLILGGDFNCTIYYDKDKNHLESHLPSIKEFSFLTHLWFNWCGRRTLIHKIGNILDSRPMLTFFLEKEDGFYTFKKHLILLKISYIHSNSFSFVDHSIVVLDFVSSSLQLLTCRRIWWHVFSNFFFIWNKFECFYTEIMCFQDLNLCLKNNSNLTCLYSHLAKPILHHLDMKGKPSGYIK